MQRVDIRISRLLKIPLSFLEAGYLHRFKPSHMTRNMHMDQTQQALSPQRTASVVIYLEDQPLGSGHTVFPLARLQDEMDNVNAVGRSHCSEDTSQQLHVCNTQQKTLFPSEQLASKMIGAWNKKLTSGQVKNRFFQEGHDLLRLGQYMCSQGYGVRPEKGAALIFHYLSDAGKETIQVTHGACGLLPNAPSKHVIAKFGCNGVARET